MNFLNLQPELHLIIFSYLDSYFLINNITLVCKHFLKLVNENYVWRKRFIENFSDSLYGFRDLEVDEFKKITCTSDLERRRWENNGFNMNKCVIQSHSSDLTFHLHLLKDQSVCVSASTNDFSLKFWDLKKVRRTGVVQECDVLLRKKQNAHNDWITSIESSNSKLCTGSWDRMLNIWDLEQNTQPLYAAQCGGDILCLAADGDVVAAGVYSIIKLFDTRTRLLPIQELFSHSDDVLDVCVDDKYIISTSDDSTIRVYDRRTNGVIKHLQCSVIVRRLSYGNGFLFGGDNEGDVHLWDAGSGKFELLKNFVIGRNGLIRGLCHTFGCFITGSHSGLLEVMSSSLPTFKWASIQMAKFISDASYVKGVLAVATYNNEITIWTPK